MRDKAHKLSLGPEQFLLCMELSTNEKVVKEENHGCNEDDTDGPDSRNSGVVCTVDCVQLVVGVQG